MWISGAPGAGKTAVASTLISMLCKRGRLGSYLFCKRGDASLGNPAIVWRTVASDIAQYHPAVKDNVINFLRKPGFRDGDIQLHFQCMIEDILVKTDKEMSAAPPVIIIDALDECGLDDNQSAERRILLDTLTRWSQLPPSFKLIVTSRVERVPRSFYDHRVCRRIILETGELAGPEARKDIRVFFEKRFEDIGLTLGMPPSWPGQLVMSKLTELAAGLFIWASTAMAFMEERRGKISTKLRLVLAGNFGQHNNSIDTLYKQILDFSFKDSDDTTLALFKEVMGTIITAKVPIHHDDLKYFLRPQDENDWEVVTILHSLSSVIDVDDFLRLRHLSFAEFLTDAIRCHERFIIDKGEQHRNLTLACLRIMKIGLKFNICDLETPDQRGVTDLPERIKAKIPFHLSYSCRFWATHLCDVGADRNGPTSLLEEVSEFFHIRFLYWLEVMSLLNEVPASSVAMRRVALWAKVSYSLPHLAVHAM
jgi:hypothetical protein